MKQAIRKKLTPVAPIACPANVARTIISDSELEKFAALIYAKAGVRVSSKKKTLLSNRIRRRLRETGIDSFGEYYKWLSGKPPGDREWDAFLQEVTTHETYLFRDPAQWKWIQETYLPQLALEARTMKRPKQLRVWSAACSTGDEPTTMACCIVERLPNHKQWDIQILGTDIGIEAIRTAKQAVFTQRAIRNLESSMRRKYFQEVSSDKNWKATNRITDMLQFRHHNLLKPLHDAPFDLVFLKNVLIYFDQESKKRAVNNVLKQVKPGGYLIAGAAEGIGGLIGDLTRISPWLWKRREKPIESDHAIATHTAK